MLFNKLHFIGKSLFIASIGILSASAPLSTQMYAMEVTNKCGTCGQKKPQLNLAYLAIRANRCTECRAILTRPTESTDTLAQIITELAGKIQILENQSVSKQQLQDAFEARMKALESRIAQTEAYSAGQLNQRSPWIERGSWLLGTLATAIAHNRKFSANQSALIGLGTAATSYAIATLALKK